MASFRIMEGQYIRIRRGCHPVLHTPELLLTIFDTLREPQLTLDGKAKGASLLKFMLVCKHWYFTIRRIIWSHLTRPNEAFDAVLRQYDDNIVHFSHQEQLFRRSGEAYSRYSEHAGLVRSISNYLVHGSAEHEVETALKRLDGYRAPFISLERLDLRLRSSGLSFPRCFQTGTISDLTLSFLFDDSVADRIGILHQIADTCPKLERLTLKTELSDPEFNFLRPYPFRHLRALSVRVKQDKFDDIMRVVILAPHKIAELELYIIGGAGRFLPTRHRKHEMHALRTITLQVDDGAALTTKFRALPRAPNLHRCVLKTNSTLLSGTCNALFRAIEEYSHSSPFTEMEISIAGVTDSLPPLTISPLLRMRWLTDISLIISIGPDPELLHPSEIVGVWLDLHKLELIFGGRRYDRLEELLEVTASL